MDPMVPENVAAADFAACAQSGRYCYLGLVSRENRRLRFSQEIVAVVIVSGDTDRMRRVMGRDDLKVLMRQPGNTADHAVLSRADQDIEFVKKHIENTEDKKQKPTDSLRCYLFDYQGPRSLEGLDTDQILQVREEGTIAHDVEAFISKRKVQIAGGKQPNKGSRGKPLTLDAV
jgi:hypothetical protein